MTTPRHKWSAPDRYPYKTERSCVRCGLVKVTRHEPPAFPWIEYWRGVERLDAGGRTPPCPGKAAPAPASADPAAQAIRPATDNPGDARSPRNSQGSVS